MGSTTVSEWEDHVVIKGRCYVRKNVRTEEYLGPCKIHNPSDKKKPGRKPKQVPKT